MAQSGAIRAGKAFVEFFADKSPFVKALRSMEKDLKDFGGKLMSIGSQMATVGAIAAAGFASAATAFASAGAEIQKQADKLGLTTEQYQLLQFAAKTTGKDVEDLAKQFADGSLDLEAYRKRAEELGVVMSGEDVAAASQLSQVFGELTGAVSALWQKVGAALAPTLTDLGSRLATIVGAVVEWVDGNRPLVATIAAVVAGVAAAGAGLVAVGGVLAGAGVAFGAVSTVIAGIGTILGAVLSPVGLLVAGVTAVGVAFFTMTDAGKQATSTLLQAFQDLAGRVKEAWGGISDALAAGDLALAGRIAFAALNIEWMKATEFLKGIWRGFTTSFLNAWDATVSSFSGLFIDGLAGMQSAWTGVTDLFLDAWDGTWSAMYRISAGIAQTVYGMLASIAELIADVTGVDLSESVRNVGNVLSAESNRVADQIDGRMMERQQARQQKLQQIEADRLSSRSIIDEDLRRKILDRQKRNQDAADKAEAKLNAAKADYAKMLKEAADKRQSLVDAASGKTPETAPATTEGTGSTAANELAGNMDKYREQLAKAGDARRMMQAGRDAVKQTTAGTFSAAAAARMSGSDPMLTENREQTRLLRQIANKQMTFG